LETIKSFRDPDFNFIFLEIFSLLKGFYLFGLNEFILIYYLFGEVCRHCCLILTSSSLLKSLFGLNDSARVQNSGQDFALGGLLDQLAAAFVGPPHVLEPDLDLAS
jgi:hypothetical protein